MNSLTNEMLNLVSFVVFFLAGYAALGPLARWTVERGFPRAIRHHGPVCIWTAFLLSVPPILEEFWRCT